MELLVGADPEIFLKSDARTYASAYGLIPGTKKKPYPVENGAVQVDGTALEFNITPAKSSDEFVHNIQHVMSTLRAMIPKEYEFTKDVTARFPTISQMPKEARMIGCDPDYNAWSEQKNQSFNEHSLGDVRMVGGHVHLGWTKDADPLEYSHFLSCCQIAKQLDYFLLLPSLLFDTDSTRKSYYGKPGAFRPKPYGMEYRSLSNFWIHDKHLTEMVYNQTVAGFNLFVDKDVEIAKRTGNTINTFVKYSKGGYYADTKHEIKNWIKGFPEVYNGIKELVNNA